MLATISPSIDDIEETVSTLDYAQCASQIQPEVRPCQRGTSQADELSQSIIHSLQLQVSKLQALLNDREDRNAATQGCTPGTCQQKSLIEDKDAEIAKLRAQLDSKDAIILDLRRKVKSRESYAREMEVVVRDATAVILRDATRNSQAIGSLKHRF